MTNVDVAGTGFTVLDRIYSGTARAVVEALGGSCGNVLVSLAMLRRRVAPILALGRDETGQRLVCEFERAGADTGFISRHEGRRSPILAQLLDPGSGSHRFASTCPETSEALPRYLPIGSDEVEHALPVLRRCSVFYTDRISTAVVEAMEAASGAGSIVLFEPSAPEPSELFERALASTSILKFSADRMGETVEAASVPSRMISIVTHGAEGLEIRRGTERRWMPSFAAPDVRDTCGAGDMVSVGLIHWLLALRPEARDGLPLAAVLPGVRAGQRLAAANCAFVGARGLFSSRGPEAARAILEG